MEVEDFVFLRRNEVAMKIAIAWGHLNEQGGRVPGPARHSFDAWSALACVHLADIEKLAPTLFAIDAIREDGSVDETCRDMIRGFVLGSTRQPKPKKPGATENG